MLEKIYNESIATMPGRTTRNINQKAKLFEEKQSFTEVVRESEVSIYCSAHDRYDSPNSILTDIFLQVCSLPFFCDEISRQ